MTTMMEISTQRHDSGINGILDYAAENAPDEVVAAEEDENQPARIFQYESEATCEHHVAIFKSCIDAVKTVTPNGFAALKITALGDPVLLERMSRCIVEAARLFDKFDKDGDKRISREEFVSGYEEFFETSHHGFMDGLLNRLDPTGTGRIDVVEWSNLLQPTDVPKLVSRCREEGPLLRAAPTAEDLEALENTKRRLDEVAKFAFENKVSEG